MFYPNFRQFSWKLIFFPSILNNYHAIFKTLEEEFFSYVEQFLGHILNFWHHFTQFHFNLRILQDFQIFSTFFEDFRKHKGIFLACWAIFMSHLEFSASLYPAVLLLLWDFTTFSKISGIIYTILLIFYPNMHYFLTNFVKITKFFLHVEQFLSHLAFFA